MRDPRHAAEKTFLLASLRGRCKKMKVSISAFSFTALLLSGIVIAAAAQEQVRAPMPIGRRVEIKAPLGLPPVPIPQPTIRRQPRRSLSDATYTMTLPYRQTARSRARHVTRLNSGSPITGRFRQASAASLAAATRRQSSIRRTTRFNSGMGARPAWRSRRRVRSPILWKWRTHSMAS